MSENYEKMAGPVVSVLVPTFNRPQYLHKALASVLGQSYKNLQVLVVNDGGEDVSDIIRSFQDPRLVFINRKENCGKAYSLNEALERAKGKYVAYLDDDDIYYPNHIRTLVDTLERDTDCQVAYSDFYKVYCKVMSDGTRQVLSKVVEVSRDFDRFLMLLFNHVLHVCMMHRLDLLDKTGPYNEQLNVLIDWDMARRLVFFSDFHHVYEITGEYYHPMGDCDRISVQQRKDTNKYFWNLLTIRTTRPLKPWPKIKDMSIIFLTDAVDLQTAKAIITIWRCTFYPYKIYMPMPKSEFSKLNTDMPNLIFIPVNETASAAQRIDAALEKCDGEYIGIVSDKYPVKDLWIETSIYAMINNPTDRQVLELEESTNEHWAAVIRKEDLLNARRNRPDLAVYESLKAAGMTIRKPDFKEYPFQFDNLLQQAKSAGLDGNWLEAAGLFEHIAENHRNRLWMITMAAKAFYKAGDLKRALILSSEINNQRPSIDTLLLEAKIKRNDNNFDSAIELLESAERILNNEMQYFSEC